jgi:hypothetical protein
MNCTIDLLFPQRNNNIITTLSQLESYRASSIREVFMAILVVLFPLIFGIFIVVIFRSSVLHHFPDDS